MRPIVDSIAKRNGMLMRFGSCRHFYPGSLRYIKYHGQERDRLNTQLDQQDVILTTYGTVMADRRRGNSILHRIDWYRLVLDEGELIQE